MKRLFSIILVASFLGCTRVQPEVPKGAAQPPQPSSPLVVPPLPVAPPPPPAPISVDGTYSGTWLTTNRKLDGTMKCVLTSAGQDKWQGQFSGVWEGRSFSYKI